MELHVKAHYTKLLIWQCCGNSVFIVENNGYAMGTSVERTANHTDIWKLGLGYEMPCGPVDGMNPVKVKEAMTEANR
jgi:TPP-dependent pyruvate/acetoin dehydrogenase alpha subunit